MDMRLTAIKSVYKIGCDGENDGGLIQTDSHADTVQSRTDAWARTRVHACGIFCRMLPVERQPIRECVARAAAGRRPTGARRKTNAKPMQNQRKR